MSSTRKRIINDSDNKDDKKDSSMNEQLIENESDASPILKRLHFYHELDEWQQDNHYIKSGYVKETGTFSGCFESLTYLHNESINIYSHLIPSLFVLVSIAYYINFQLTIYPNYLGIWEKLNFLQFGLAATACMFMSSTFHCIKSHSQKICKIGNQLDYFGIIILITCSLISVMLFAFYDEPFWKYFYIIIFLILGSICTVLTLNPKFATPTYRPFRSLMFIIFGLSGLLPVITAVKLFGYEIAVQRSAAQWLVLEGVFYIFGAVLYAMRIPERFTHVEEKLQAEQDEREENHGLFEKKLAGTFDIFGHSHQIFHVMVVVAAYCHWRSLVGCYDYLHQEILPNLL